MKTDFVKLTRIDGCSWTEDLYGTDSPLNN